VEDFIGTDAVRPSDGVSVGTASEAVASEMVASEVAASPVGVVEATSACPLSSSSESELA
jgi:hypothetical protein